MNSSQSWQAWILSCLEKGRDAFEEAGFTLALGPAEALRIPVPMAPSRPSTGCASCARHKSSLLYGEDPDGFVICRECRSPLFYCDIGGQG